MKISSVVITAAFLIMSCKAFALSNNLAMKQCRQQMNNNPPVIDITYNYGELRYDTTKTSAELEKIHDKNKPIFGHMHGLTQTSPKLLIETKINGQQLEDKACFYPARVKISLSYTPVLYIMKDLKPGSCKFNLTLRHEQTHLDISHLALKEFAAQLKEQIPLIIKDIGPIVKNLSDEDDSTQKAAREMNQSYNKQMEVLFELFKKTLEEENGKIDTAENYRFESSLCSD